MGNPVPEHDPSGDKLPEDSHCTLFAELKRQVCTSQHSLQTPLSLHWRYRYSESHRRRARLISQDHACLS